MLAVCVWSPCFRATVRGSMQVRRNARDLRLMFPRVQPVVPVVVLWGHPGPADPVRVVGDVTVVGGLAFADWLTGWAGDLHEGWDPAVVDKAWDVLSAHVERRDLHDQVKEPPHVNLDRTFKEVFFGRMAGVLAIFVVASVNATWFLPLSCASALLAWRVRGRTKHSLGLAAAAVTIGVAVLGLVMFVTVTLVVRQLT